MRPGTVHSECLGFPGLFPRVSVETSPPSCMTTGWHRAAGSLSEFSDLLNFPKQLLWWGLAGRTRLEAQPVRRDSIWNRQRVCARVNADPGMHSVKGFIPSGASTLLVEGNACGPACGAGPRGA